MSKHQRKTLLQKLCHRVFSVPQRMLKQLIRSALHRWYVLNRHSRWAKAGFVLPTVTMVLLVVGLLVGTMLLRTAMRTEQVIGQREEAKIYNTATPAMERAKAKLEFLFKRDNRLPASVPPEIQLEEFMLNATVPPADDVYTLPGETRIDIGGTNGTNPDNAWVYQTDLDGDGTEETIVYSISMRTEYDEDGDGDLTGAGESVTSSDLQAKAENGLTRTGPLTLKTTAGANPSCAIPELKPEQGWYAINSASVRKNFQINAVVVNNNPVNRSVSTLELQQDRQMDKGNKWGAWFRYDLELYPGPGFNWNGAMHTESNLIIGQGNNNFRAYLISSLDSCLYTEDASEITLAQQEDQNGVPTFQGQVIAGSRPQNNFSGSAKIDRFTGQGTAPETETLNSTSDSVSTTGQVEPITVDTLLLFTKDKFKSETGTAGTEVRANTWSGSNLNQRMFNKVVKRPFVDDTYRADNRWGPKPQYKEDEPLNRYSVPAGSKVGDPIAGVTAGVLNTLTENNPPPSFQDEVGLDGYWERRARNQGLRLIVGQRLELGNPFGWEGNNDPLYPPDSISPPPNLTANQYRQQRTLRDNLAAVQATAVYHHESSSGNFPVACLATTAHNANMTVRGNSTDFSTASPHNSRFESNFFIGKGTNGWEYAPPANNYGSSTELGKALRNLAHFAGDPFGAFPATQDTSSTQAVSGLTVTHPYPELTMWGDFSNLRRTLKTLDTSGTSYNDLSFADQSNLHTASCMLGMLANNIYDLDTYSPTAAELTELDTALQGVSLSTGEPPDAYIAQLSGSAQQTAQRLHLQAQLDRDRRFGFKETPSAGSEAPTADYQRTLTNLTSDFSYGGVTYNATDTVDTGCKYTASDPTKSNFGLGALDSETKEKQFIRLATALCSRTPKYPSLYYLFPEYDHDHDGGDDGTFNHTQPTGESYIADAYIKNADVNGTEEVTDPDYYTYKTVNPTSVAIAPRANASSWVLPISTTGGANQVKDRDGSDLYVPFLDSAFFDGRELMAVRALNIDLDLLENTNSADSWLPGSGIVYAFREDAVREDAIARPANAAWAACNTEATLTATATCLMQTDPASPQDPPLNADNGISPKPVDFYADPDRRPHGFRLLNGKDLRGGTAASRIGISFISDNPVYIQGDFNLHSTDGTTDNLIEEFETPLAADWSNFYDRNGNPGTTDVLNTDFAQPDEDHWRPAEIIGDTVTILSNSFCDGTIESGIRNTNDGCSTGTSSYRNRPINKLFDESNDIYARDFGSWVRENPDDSDSPIKVTKNAQVSYNLLTGGGTRTLSDLVPPTVNLALYSYYRPINAIRCATNDCTASGNLNQASETRVNAVLVNGLVPSRAGQSYGGFHNFPRSIESWKDTNLHIAGSFLQLNFSTYGTAPYDQEAWEPGEVPTTGSVFSEYTYAPDRRWGYDPALQYNPPAPITERFVSVGSPRSEFYKELPVDDPYIKNLRCAEFTPSGGTARQVDQQADCS